VPILQQYGPALLQQAEAAEALARRLVGEWLRAYMFEGVSDAEKKANEIADYFADFNRHQSHNLGIDRDQAKAVGVKIEDLEADSQLQDAVLSVHHAMLVTLQGPAVKIVENHAGKAFFKVAQQIAVQVPMQPQPPGGAPTLLPGTPPAP
jgi:hypothetical protein